MFYLNGKKWLHRLTTCLLVGETMLLLGEGVENFTWDIAVEVSVGWAGLEWAGPFWPSSSCSSMVPPLSTSCWFTSLRRSTISSMEIGICTTNGNNGYYSWQMMSNAMHNYQNSFKNHHKICEDPMVRSFVMIVTQFWMFWWKTGLLLMQKSPKKQNTKILTMSRDHTPGKPRLVHYIIFWLYFVLSRNLFLTEWSKFAGMSGQTYKNACHVAWFKLNKKWNNFLIFLLRGEFSVRFPASVVL